MSSINHRIDRGYGRRSGLRPIKQSFLIITEGVNTEPDYFTSFRLTSASIQVIGEGMSCLSLVKKAISIRDNLKKRGRTYDQNWVVFDKDDNPDKTFNDAIVLAQKENFHVAYSNQAFEYWFLLHFKKYKGCFSRIQMNKMLSKILGETYTKKSGHAAELYIRLLPLQQEAITRAKEIFKEMSHGNPAKEESTTTVFQLVEQLNQFL